MGNVCIHTNDLKNEGLDLERVDLGFADMRYACTDLGTSEIVAGFPGKDGVGIERIDTEQSEEELGENKVTITLTNKEQHTFVIRNGSSYKLSEKDKEELVESTLIVIGKKFITKDEVKTVKLIDAAPPTETTDGVDGFVTALDAKTYIEDNLSKVLHFEDYHGEPIIIKI